MTNRGETFRGADDPEPSTTGTGVEHDGLGGPQHNPVIIPALVFPECIWGACDHEKCPTYEAIACGTCPTDDGLGLVGFGREWPCPHSTAEDAKAGQS